MCILEKNLTLSGLLILLEEKPNGSHPSLRNKIKRSYKFEQIGKTQGGSIQNQSRPLSSTISDYYVATREDLILSNILVFTIMLQSRRCDKSSLHTLSFPTFRLLADYQLAIDRVGFLKKGTIIHCFLGQHSSRQNY